ncbi:purine and uridine phosphorylase, partial [Aureobasidium melanogenum]
MSNPNDYTILWICALTTEYVAAQTFLDEEHPKPAAGTIAISDTNAYTLGRIAGHRVVLAVLPKGEYGVGSAASVITHILRSFPSIRIGLMVGIGGGVPTKANDIRLGDIVVSSPKDGHGGVFHYDLGKEIQDPGFKQTGFLNQPPTVVRTAVSALESKHIRRGHNIIETIEHALKENTRLKRKGYARPAPESDRLYKSDVLVERHPRDDEDDDPAIHYGLIGSGNKVIKDATLRDKLAREEGILCFEMEAAGIMNRFPCLVVRGICDYSDSHKNKQWQGYAAMTAAAYTKELLMEIPGEDVEKEERLAVAIEQLTSNVRDVAEAMEQIKTANASDAVTKWLKAADPSVNYMRAIETHRPGTGEWFIHGAQFEAWKAQTKSFLWLHGLSGCGKTILSAAIIEHLLSQKGDLTIYFYFNFSNPNKQHHKDMLRSLLLQLYYKSPIAQAFIQDCYRSHEHGQRQPTMDQLRDTLDSVLEQLKGVKIVLDALDEAQSVTEIVQWCRQIDSAKLVKLEVDACSFETHSENISSNSTQTILNPDVLQTRLDASLLAAASEGYRGIVQDLLVRGARPDRFRMDCLEEKCTALQMASRAGRTEVVRVLIKGGALVNLQEDDGDTTALFAASEEGHADVVKVLLANNADPNLYSRGWSPLRVAIFARHTAVAQALISAGASLTDRAIEHPFAYPGSWIGQSTLLALAVIQENERMAQILFDNGASTQDVDEVNQTVLHLAVVRCGTTIIKLLLDHNASADAPGPEGTPLTVAARLGRHDVVKILLDYATNRSG